jgi:maleate cis-trans isomerase
MFVELERARMTKILSDMKEAEGATAEAADILSEVQVDFLSYTYACRSLDSFDVNGYTDRWKQ